MERKQMEVDFLTKGIEEFIDNEKEILGKEDDEKVQLSHSKSSVPISSSKNIANKQLSKLLEMNRDNVLRGIIFSEILGSPRARRKR